MKRYWWVLGGVVAVIAILAFLAFRPDKLFVDDTVDESLSDAFTTTTAPAPPATTSTTTASDDAPASSSTTTTTEPSGPAVIGDGAFYGIDHSATGTAVVYEQGGTFVLRFEDDTDIQNGPDLFVWLLADSDYTEGTPPDFIDLGKIKGNVGGQNYTLAADYDPDVHQFVLIWCKRFTVPFAAAPLA